MILEYIVVEYLLLGYTRRHIPEEDTLQNHRCENLKFYEYIVVGVWWMP
jgi:hypothetical protein